MRWSGSAGNRVPPVRHPTARRSTAEPLGASKALRAKEESRSVTDAGLLTLSRRPLAEERDTSGSTQDKARAADGGARAQIRARRSQRRCRLRPTTRGPRTSLRTKSLGPMTLARYRVEIKQFLGHCDNQASLRVQTQRGDETLARNFNTLFFRARGSRMRNRHLRG